MTVFSLKLLAIFSMLIDHTGYFLMARGLANPSLYTLMRSIGRMAFPIYAFLLVNGFCKTSSRARYLSRLILFAALSQIPFTLVFSSSNYSLPVPSFSAAPVYAPLLFIAAGLLACAAWYFCVRRDASVLVLVLALVLAEFRLTIGGVRLLNRSLNIFYTLSLSLALLCLLDAVRERRLSWPRLALCAAALLSLMLLLLPNSDYDTKGLALILALFLLSRSRYAQALAICLWGMYEYLHLFVSIPRLVFVCLAALCAAFYNGRRGRPVKLGFYLVYPAHLLLLAAVNFLLLFLSARAALPLP